MALMDFIPEPVLVCDECLEESDEEARGWIALQPRMFTGSSR